ncbi:LINC01376 isoform 4 [Pan troglodytes]|uniref:LINC01376 isoform 4 n=1 Tax=Pan troglodytes TaxID=9598 RepID=A0A2J8NLN7_PANTR|nr:LINC01376 isoform 4 [Pan troglodytes]
MKEENLLWTSFCSRCGEGNFPESLPVRRLQNHGQIRSGSVAIAHCSLKFLRSSNPPTSASQVDGNTAMGSHCVAQAGLKLQWLKQSFQYCLPRCWDYKREPQHLATEYILNVLIKRDRHSFSL